MTITEFILARVAEDEKAANLAVTPGEYDVFIDDERTFYQAIGEHRDDWGLYTFNVPPGRVLAECEVKRRIVELVREWDEDPGPHSPEFWHAPMWDVLYALALPHADHPDFREEWRR